MKDQHPSRIPPPAVERMAAAPRLGVAPGGLEWPRDCPGARRDAGRGEPVAEAGARRRRPSLGPSHAPGLGAAAVRRAAGAVADPARSRGRSVWLCGRRVDQQAGRGGDQAGIWRRVPPRACQSPPPADRLERSEADPTCPPARRAGHYPVGPRAVAGASSKAQSERRTIVWVDESAFYPLPGVVRTYAPRGETPILRSLVTHDHLSVISGLTMDGRLLMQRREQAFRGPEVVGFLRHLLRHLPGPLLVIWDGAPIHRAHPVKDFLAQGAAARLQLEQLPGYAPELNPDEGIWHYLKHVELGNLCCGDLAELRLELQLATKRLRHKHTVLRGCIAQCGYAA